MYVVVGEITEDALIQTSPWRDCNWVLSISVYDQRRSQQGECIWECRGVKAAQGRPVSAPPECRPFKVSHTGDKHRYLFTRLFIQLNVFRTRGLKPCPTSCKNAER